METQLKVPKSILDAYVKEVASDPKKETELEDLPGLPDVSSRIPTQLSNKSFSFSKFKAILKRKKSTSAHGPNKIPYTVYKKCNELARYLWAIHRAVSMQLRFLCVSESMMV